MAFESTQISVDIAEAITWGAAILIFFGLQSLTNFAIAWAIRVKPRHHYKEIYGIIYLIVLLTQSLIVVALFNPLDNLVHTVVHVIIPIIIPPLAPYLHGGATFVVNQTAVIIAAIGSLATVVYVRDTRRMRLLQERIAADDEESAVVTNATLIRIAEALERLAPPTSSSRSREHIYESNGLAGPTGDNAPAQNVEVHPDGVSSHVT